MKNLVMKIEAPSCEVAASLDNTGKYSVFISANEFSELANIPLRTAQFAANSCLNGGEWKGHKITVKKEGGELNIFVASLPKDLRDKWHKRHPAALTPQTVTPIMLPAPESYDSRMGKEVTEWRWKLSIIALALDFPRHSQARGTVLADIAAKVHITPDGKSVTYTANTLRAWLRAVEEGEHKALARKRRKKGLRRNIITREWDKAAPFPEPEKRRIAAEIEKYTRDLWRNVTSGWSKIDLLTSSKLWEQSREAGWSDVSREVCKVGRHWVERHRAVGLVAIKEKDAKRFADDFTPRIIRNRDGYKPMDVVIGDVHPLDVVKLHDGREVHARLIAWLDLATNDIHVTPILLPKGRGVRQEDIARSFVSMVNDWGLPRSLYLDNGTEYKWGEMVDGFAAITSAVNTFHVFINESETEEIRRVVESNISNKPLTRAKPYNAPAKQIEGVFGILERGFFSMLPGWIGGERMNKRTHKLGAQPRPFDGSKEEFEAALNEALNFYRNTPQNNSTSPNEKRAAFYAQGWRPYTAPREVFLFAFSEVDRRKVKTSGIEKDDEDYYSDAIIPFVGQTIEIRFAKWDRSTLFIIDPSGKPIAIPKTQTYGQLDKAGAIEQSRRAGVMNTHLRALKDGTQKLDLLDEVKRHNATYPPAPVLPQGIPINLGAESQALHDALQAAPLALVMPPLTGGTIQHKTTGQVLTIAPPKPEGNNAKVPPIDLVAAITANHQKEKKK